MGDVDIANLFWSSCSCLQNCGGLLMLTKPVLACLLALKKKMRWSLHVTSSGDIQ
jgi:hypothetical protein